MQGIRSDFNSQHIRGFTLVELLIALGIIAVISVVAVMVINPVELLKRSRDVVRIADLVTVNKAVAIYNLDISGSLGIASTTYVSIPDPAATTTAGTNCASLGLPAASSGIGYHCSSPSNYRNVDGTGWIPLNFNLISMKSPLGVLPVDPTQATSTGMYYTYSAIGGNWEITATTESDKYSANAWDEGGNDPMRVEVGANLAIAPRPGLTLFLDASQIAGLSDGSPVSQWNDLSGFGKDATQASPTQQPLYETNILNSEPVVRFDGTDDRLAIPSIAWGTAIAVAKRTVTSNSLFERSVAKRGFSVLAYGTTYDTFDRYYVNGALATAPSNWLTSFAVVSGVLQSSVLTATANLGYGSPSFSYLNGDIAEVLVWNYKISDADRKKVERYLGKKYGIAVP